MKVDSFDASTQTSTQTIYLEARFRSIVSKHDSEVYPIEMRTANEMLELFRQALQPYNTKRHAVAISDRDGIGVILINGSAHWLWRCSFRHNPPVITTLLRIRALLQPRFVQYVRNARIN